MAAPASLPPTKSQSPAGFSLVAASLGILVLSLLAAVAAPIWKHHQTRARAQAVAADLREFARVLQAFSHDRGDWPVASPAPGRLPVGSGQLMPAPRWESVTPIGGRYLWARETLQQGERYQAAILIVSSGAELVSKNRELLTAVDQVLDDGNLATGKFRLGFRHEPVFVLEP